jgi:CRP/FNR family transcriptional regulator, cyclic AMP receptor protein
MPRASQRKDTPAPRSTVEILRSARIFADLPDDVLERLGEACVRRSYDRGQYLWYQGDDDARLVVVAVGRLKVVISSEQGDEVLLTTLGPGESLGELALLDGSPRSAAVVAVEPTSVLMLSRSTVLTLLGRHPSVLDALLRSLGGLVRRLTEQAGDLVFLDVGGRLAKLLLRLAEADEGATAPAVVDLGLSQSDLAAMVGATRPAVNRALQVMATRGLITLDGRTIVLRDIAALRRRAEL